MSAYKTYKGLIFQKLESNKTVVYDVDNAVIYTLNNSASDIFRWIKKGLNKKEIVDCLVNKYKIKVNRADKDVDDLIDDLSKNRIIRINNENK